MVAPKGLEVLVTEPVIHDPAFPLDIEAGDILLAVGTTIGGSEAIKLLAEAGHRGVAAIAFKVRSQPPSQVVKSAEASGVAILSVPPELSWGHLHALLRTAVASTHPTLEQHAAAVSVGDLFGLANALAATVGAPVAIADRQFRLLAYSNLDQPIDEIRLQAIVSRRAMDSWVRRIEEDGTMRTLWTTNEVVHVEAFAEEGLRRRLAIAVRAGSEILGSIWVVEGSTRLGAAAEKALREAASIAALHLVRHWVTERLERHVRGELVQSALEGREPPDIVASRLGFDVDGSLTVIAFEMQSQDEAELAVKQEPVLDLVTLHGQAFRRRSACASLGSVIYALLPTPEPVNPNQIMTLAREIVARAGTGLRVRLHAGIGSTVSSLRDAPRSRREADQVLRVLISEAGDSIDRTAAHIDEVRSKIALLELKDLALERPELRSPTLETLAERDAAHGTSYIDTLRAYLDSFGDIREAARVIGVHPNTLRYRLARILEVSGLNLSDAEERLVAQLQIRFLANQRAQESRGQRVERPTMDDPG